MEHKRRHNSRVTFLKLSINIFRANGLFRLSNPCYWNFLIYCLWKVGEGMVEARFAGTLSQQRLSVTDQTATGNE